MKETPLNELEKSLLLVLRKTLSSLYPQGKVEGREFTIGDVSGDSGKSLKINLNTGLWSDFSAGAQGRILKFFAYRNNNDFQAGLKEVRSILKLPDPPASNKFKKPKKDWLDDVDYASSPMRYLIKERGIPKSVLSKCKVREAGDNYIFTGYDEENRLCYAQYIGVKRDAEGKKIVRFSPAGKAARLCLWGMNTMRDLSVDGSVVITEGVIDAMTFRTTDIFAVSIPSGINNTDWIEHSWNWLAQFKTIYLALDYDESGQKDIAEIAGRLGIYRCKKVIIPDKDANDCMKKNPDTWTQLLRKCLTEATDFTPKKRLTAKDIKDMVIESINSGPMMNQGDLLFGWLFEPTELDPEPINFRFRPHELTLWTGYPGGGKSTALSLHAAYCMFILGEKVALASLEERVEIVITTMLTQAIGLFPETDSALFNRAYEIISERLIIFNELGTAPIDEILEFFEYAVKKDGVKHCILDSLMCTDVDIDGDKEKVNDMVRKVIASLNSTGAHYNIVAHPVKGDDEDWATIPKMKDIKGIQEIAGKAHNVLIVWRNKVKVGSIDSIRNQYATDIDRKKADIRAKQIQQPDAIIKVAKNRYGKKVGQIKVWFDIHSSRFRPGPEKSCDGAYIEADNNGPP